MNMMPTQSNSSEVFIDYNMTEEKAIVQPFSSRARARQSTYAAQDMDNQDDDSHGISAVACNNQHVFDRDSRPFEKLNNVCYISRC